MFAPIEIPFGCVMLFNVVDLKDGVSVEDVEVVLGEMCNVVKNTYGDDNGGFNSIGYGSHWWLATEYSANYAWRRALSNSNANIK